jgi:chromosome segregation ATPase
VPLSSLLRDWLLAPVLAAIALLSDTLLRRIDMNEQQTLERLAALQEQLDGTTAIVVKVGTETDGLKAEVVALKDALAQAGNTTPAVDAAFAALEQRAASLGAAVTDVDAKVVDAVAPAP